MLNSDNEKTDEFRVRVSLERYFSDARARCYMSCSRGAAVRSLARRLRRTFRLPRDFVLVSRGHLLPPAEPLALLREDDPVQVIPMQFPAVERRAMQNRSTPSPAFPSRSVSPSSEVDASTAVCTEVAACIPSTVDTTDAIPSDVDAPAAVPCKAEATAAAPCEQDVTDAASCEADASDAVSCEADSAPSLEDMKRRALDMISQYLPPVPSRRPRRRARRRRAPAPAPADEARAPRLVRALDAAAA